MSLRTALIITASVIGLLIPAFAEAQSSARTTANLTLRAGPDINYAKIAGMPRGAQIHVLQCSWREWCQVSYAGRTGWASQRYLDFGRAIPVSHLGISATHPTGVAAIGPMFHAAPHRTATIHRWQSPLPDWHNVKFWDGWHHRDEWHYYPPQVGFDLLIVR